MESGEDCLRAKPEFRSRPSAALRPKETSGSGGALLFGYFVLGKQNKVTRLEAKRSYHSAQYVSVITPYLLVINRDLLLSCNGVKFTYAVTAPLIADLRLTSTRRLSPSLWEFD